MSYHFNKRWDRCDKLYAFTSSSTGGLASSSWPMFNHDNQHTGNSTGSTNHFKVAYSSTGNNSTVLIQTTTTITVNDNPFTLLPGDEIAIYTPLSDTICCGVGKLNGNNLSITVWGDNDQTATIKEGFTSGQAYTFHIWDASESKEYRFCTATFSSGNSTYSANGISIVSGLTYTSSHFRVAYTSTGSNSTIMVPATPTITVDGMNVSLGLDDEIAIYTPLPDTMCCGVGKWTGSNLSITVWGDNDQTANVKEGFTSGQQYRFHLWDASVSKEYRNFSSAVFSSGNATYSANGISTVSRLNFSTVDSLSINLSSGWNMISSNVKATDSSMSSIFNSIVSNVVIVKNNGGQVYWPEYGVNQIGSWRIIDGYMVYMRNGATLRVSGNRINPVSTSMTLPSGWSMIAYLPNVSIAPSTALASLGSTIVIVKDGSGNVYWPQYEVDQIGTMKVGKGYQIYLSSSGTLTYPASASKEAFNMVEGRNRGQISPQRFAYVRGTGSNATILIRMNEKPVINGTAVEVGDEIGVFTSEGICAGAGVWNGENIVITVWGDNGETASIDGFTDGQAYTFKLWDKSAVTEKEISVVAQSGNLNYSENGITIVSLEKNSTTPENFVLRQNYPNPFNPSTRIEYQIKTQSEVTLAIYNTAGQLIRMLVQSTQPAGMYSVEWDGRNDSGIQVPSSIYLYRLQAGSVVETRKTVLMK